MVDLASLLVLVCVELVVIVLVHLQLLNVLLVSGDDPFLPLHVPLELLDEALLLRDYLLHGLQRCYHFL